MSGAAQAAYAPVTAEAEQPMPVTSGMREEPPSTMSVLSPSVMKSRSPLMLTTQAKRSARRRAESTASRLSFRLSTPLVLGESAGEGRRSALRISAARAMISEALPRTICGRTMSRRRREASVRRREAPAPTGSSTTGLPLARMSFPASSMLSSHGASSVPILRTRAESMSVRSSSSSGAWAMSGEAWAARRALAVTFITT